jgi:hypothetical protein
MSFALYEKLLKTVLRLMEVVPLAVLPSFFESDFPNRSF